MNQLIPIYIKSMLIILAISVITISLIVKKNNRIRKLQILLHKLKRSFYNLDEQAKLIVKTDLELNKAQEELDKRLHGLEALQKTSRLISTTLDENEIFHRLNQSLMTDLDYEKNLILVYGENKIFYSRVSSGFSEEDVHFIISNIEKDVNLINALINGNTFSSANAPKQRIESITHLFDVEHFVLTPILTQNGFIGIVFVGNRSNAPGITERDEELISILANQIGQSIENARLFEQVFLSHQSLETKVLDRTKQLESALEEVKNISKTKSEFVSAVSHELRTPLTSIKGYASILMAGKLGEIPDKVKKRLEKINMHSDNLVKLINELLDISRIESGRVEMHLEKTNMLNLIENVQDLLTPQFKNKGVNWVTEADESIPELLIDSSQVERVFINLISNAVKFTPTDGSITVRAKKENEDIQFDISDTGIGISKEDIKRLFDEFYRVDNNINQNVKGTGLGLAVAKKIVEAHGGKIWISSEEGNGTTFHFTIPIQPTNKTES